MNWKETLTQERARYMIENFQACKDFGVPKKLYSDKTANGLTKCIVDFLTYHGHYANRINTTGMMRKVNGKMIWTKGSTRKGTGDISAIINGKPVSIEVKIGRDKMSDAQHRERARIEQAGGLYFVVRNMDEFYKWYTIFTNNKY